MPTSPPPDAALAPFHPTVAAWFRERLGQPTAVQREAWPRIAAGEHVLCTAPTGSGKTLAAFLWALDQLCTGAWPTGRTTMLYVSPLKALGSDVQRNLLQPLEEICQRLRAEGHAPPTVRVLVRTGDTPANERQRMLRRPPEILVTTPESLNLLLVSTGGRRLLRDVRTVILDEIHAVAGNKRGTYLMAGVERLDRLCGGVQRVALSATVRPLETVAAFVGGYALEGEAYARRPVALVQPPSSKRLDVQVIDPAGTLLADPEQDADSFWTALAAALKPLIHAHRSTLFFVNSRRMAEKLARFLNREEPEPLAWSHHGSLSKSLRFEVEQKLKHGELRALVATSSLELGIDIGDLDLVVLVQAPPTISSCIQRVGRAGHQVGATSHGLFVPLHGRDLLTSAVLVPLVQAGRVEPIQPVRAPLDVLAQVVLAMCVPEPWQPDALFDFLRTCWSWQELTRPAFDLVLDQLCGRYADTRIHELVPRLRRDDTTGLLTARPGMLRLLAQSGGVIPDRGYFTIRVQGTGTRLGELDEEFVWERHIGDEFAIGAQTWRIAAITHDAVEVVGGSGSSAMAPFWRAESEAQGVLLSSAVGEFLAEADPRLGDPGFAEVLAARHQLDPVARERLLGYLQRQQQATGVLPHRRRLVIEHSRDPEDASVDTRHVIVHARWGGRSLRPWALALRAACTEKYGQDWHITSTDDCLGLQPPAGADVRALLDEVTSANVERLAQLRLGGTNFFGARFRESAGRALLLPRLGPQRRVPLWVTRQRAKRLLHAVLPYGDFPVVAETWRTCLEDELELDALRGLLDELHDGRIEVVEASTDRPSPFADNLVWSRTNVAMYDDDQPLEAHLPLHERVLREVARRGDLRPAFEPAHVAELEARLQRTALGYAPGSADEVVDLVREQRLLPEPRWQALLAAVARDHGLEPGVLLPQLVGRLHRLTLPEATVPVLVHRDDLPAVLRAVAAAPGRTALRDLADAPVPLPLPGPERAGGLAELVADLARLRGPVPVADLTAVLGLAPTALEPALATLVEAGRGVLDVLVRGDDALCYCDTDNVERLLRRQRAARRPGLQPLPLGQLPLFLAAWHGLTEPVEGLDATRTALERLFGLPLPPALWEAEVLPARVRAYQPAWLDSLLQGTELQWYGAPRATPMAEGTAGWLGFAPRSALELFAEVPADPGEAAALLPDPHARYDFETLRRTSGRPAAELFEQLWALAFSTRITNDGFATVRQAIAADFRLDAVADARLGRRLSRGLQGGRLWPGGWLRLHGLPATDEVEAAERDKERVRQLLDRHGVLFRELLAHEPPLLQWRRLLPAMRMMELSGELVAGQFFSGIQGLQFTGPAGLRRLQKPLPEDAVYWQSAVDPASCCGLGVPGLELPSRRPSTHLVWHGARLVVVSRRSGQQLDVRVPPEDPALGRCLHALATLVERPGAGGRALEVETINDEPAPRSPYRKALEAVGFVPDFKRLELRRRYGAAGA